MRRAKLTAGRGCHVQELQTRLHIAGVIVVTRGDLKQCSKVSTTGSRECDSLSKFHPEKVLFFDEVSETYARVELM